MTCRWTGVTCGWLTFDSGCVLLCSTMINLTPGPGLLGCVGINGALEIGKCSGCAQVFSLGPTDTSGVRAGKTQTWRRLHTTQDACYAVYGLATARSICPTCLPGADAAQIVPLAMSVRPCDCRCIRAHRGGAQAGLQGSCVVPGQIPNLLHFPKPPSRHEVQPAMVIVLCSKTDGVG